MISLNNLRRVCSDILGFTLKMPQIVIDDDEEQQKDLVLVDDDGHHGAQVSRLIPLQCEDLASNRKSQETVAESATTESQNVAQTESQSHQLVCLERLPKARKTEMHTKAELMGMQQHQLVRHCMSLQAKLHNRSLSLQSLRNKQRRSTRLVIKQDAKIKKQSSQSKLCLDDVDQSFAVTKRGRKLDGRKGRLSLNSIFSIGLRRCCSNVAAADFSALSMVDVSGQTVLRCEVRTAGALVQTMRQFVAEGMDLAFQHHLKSQECVSESQEWFSVMSISYRCDATNSSIWRRSKLHVLEASVQYVVDFDCLRAGNFGASVAYRRCVCQGSTSVKSAYVVFPSCLILQFTLLCFVWRGCSLKKCFSYLNGIIETETAKNNERGLTCKFSLAVLLCMALP